jgi:hypothetical protein
MKLWNPNAATNWSILFTASFGAFIHFKNWKELDQPTRAKTSLIWAIVGMVITLAAPTLSIPYLMIWYFINGRSQPKYLKENNIQYQKKGWGAPLLIMAGLVCLLVVLITLAESV